VTNQGGIAKGYYKLEDMEKTHAYMEQELKIHHIHLDDIYYCPHRNEDNCNSRKPNPGMLLRSEKDHDIDMGSSWLIGDKLSDIEAGNRARVNTILVRTGYGKEHEKRLKKMKKDNIKHPNKICKNFLEATKHILRQKHSKR